MVKYSEMDDREALLHSLAEKKIRLPEALGDGTVPPSAEDLTEAMLEAGWSEDPGTGKAVLLDDGSEVVNPVPMAPPVDYDTSPSAFDMWQANLQRMANIRDLGDMLIDDEGQEEDFDVPDPEDVIEFVSRDEIMEMFDEAPALRREGKAVEEVSPEEAKRAAVSGGNPEPNGDER